VTDQVRALIDQMVQTMRAAGGIGLAAPQVGVSLRVIVAEVDQRLVALVDPVIVRAEGSDVGVEGCLSIPGVVAAVPRAARVVVRGKNRRGRGVTLQADGLLSRVLQHEIDHLDGILFLDRVVDRSTIRRVAQTAEVEAPVPG
jgi:peptide deformylase